MSPGTRHPPEPSIVRNAPAGPHPRTRSNQPNAPATSPTAPRTPGGRATITTSTPNTRHASSFAAVAAPPEFFVTRASIPSARSSASSSSRTNGPRAAMHRAPAGTTKGASTLRTRYECQGAARNGSSSCCPTVRNTRRRTCPNAATAPAMSATSVQRSPAPATQAGRTTFTQGTPTSPAAAATFRCIRAANGCVASITAPTPSARRYAASPATPPNPPRRDATAGSTGARVRPASDNTGRNRPSPAKATASAEPSVVPPRISTFIPGIPA